MTALDFEGSWWGNCGNTFHEEQKQIAYATRVGLRPNWNAGHPPEFDLGGRSVCDIGGGPVSLLLKCANPGERLAVVDPCPYPEWVTARYEQCGISHVREKGEDFDIGGWGSFDEVWIYNVLQHVENPEHVIGNAWCHAPLIRLFEWIGIPAYEGHPHELSEALLDKLLTVEGYPGGAGGRVEYVNEGGAVGLAYFGCFAS